MKQIACIAHDAAYSDRKTLTKRTVSDKILKERAYGIAINSKYYVCEGGLATMFYRYFYKKTESVNEV